ncbi:hypothetical protein [Crenobacter cavernae]|uniref:hypothetical protein n=1 Tax=Crenobacter cavernae TaxID=2290923 RepID=UPI001FE408AE|nr:hypothetical protein [Crenobacter cavernae]
MNLCYFNGGQSMRSVDADYQPLDGEAVFDHYASDAELNAAFPGRTEQRLLDLRARQLAAINARATELLATLSAGYPDGEVQSWAQQTREAEALATDPNAATPLLTAIAAARGLVVADLAGRVRAKVQSYAVASGQIIGQRQALEDALAAIDLDAPDAEERIGAVRWEGTV